MIPAQYLAASSTEDGGKGAPPCGEGIDSHVVSNAQGGHPLAIRLNEFVFHPGHYRFALSVNSRAELPPDPETGERTRPRLWWEDAPQLADRFRRPGQ